MGMGVMLWEWEGAGTLKLIPAHLYRSLFGVGPTDIHVERNVRLRHVCIRFT